MAMILRSLVASVILAGHISVAPASAQVLLCPEIIPTDTAADEISAEAERLLKRLTIALDLHGHRGISERDIMQEHAATPSALTAKLNEVVNDCERAGDDVERFYDSLPDLRKAFLKATDVAPEAHETRNADNIKAAAHELQEAERVEESIDLSIRELWRKLWFRPAEGGDQETDRWAVIVASPSDADSGWDELGDHQRRWKDAFFQLHVPYYENNPHHAIVVGRRLPEDQARQLRDYVVEIGMAGDAYLWEVPSKEADERTSADIGIESITSSGIGDDVDGLDLSVLDQ